LKTMDTEVMLQTLISKNVVNRRRFLTLAVATAAIVSDFGKRSRARQARSQQDRRFAV